VFPVGELVVVSDPGLVHDVLTGDPEIFRAGEANGRILPILDCHSLLLFDGERHRHRRRLLWPAFHGGAMGRLHDVVVEATDRQVDGWPVGRPFPLLPSMRALTLEVILRAVIDTPRPAQAELAARVRRMLAPSASAALVLPRRHQQAWWSPARIFLRRRAAVDALLVDELRRRRNGSAADGPGDVLSLLMHALDDDGQPLPDTHICDELATLLIAGHETTSTALNWAFERILRHPSVRDRITEEIPRGDHAVLDAVVWETLRARPPLVDAVRALGCPVELGGHHLPAGAVVMVAIPLVHTRDDLFPEPHRFLPERFAESRPNPSAWVPFGGGPRRCIGAELATFEMKTVLATVLPRTRLIPAEPPAERVRLAGTALVPDRGGSVILTQRSARA
jgi:cytochrome P450